MYICIQKDCANKYSYTVNPLQTDFYSFIVIFMISF